MTAVHRNRFWLATALVLTALKLWLSRGQGVYAIGSAGHDDRLFIELAQHLVRGEWLGPYHELTLAKGPFYPLFIAAVFALGVPLFLAQHLFYATAAGLFVQALRPAVTSAAARLAMYALLLWNPMTFDGPAMGRVLRQHVYGPLGLMIFAGLIALYLRRSEPARRQAPWVLLLGLATGAFYLTREEGVWIIPSALLLAGACLFGAWKISRATAQRTAGSLALALVVAALPVLVVCAQNQRHYGWFGTCEMREPNFQAAYGAMLRVRVGPELRFVPVTREARAAMAAVSPAFAEVQKHFDAGVARGWAGASEFFTHLPPEQEQIGGGWMFWGLRDAATKAGHHGNAAQARLFYGQLAQELNQACDSGRLPAGPPRNGFLPAWRDDWTGPFLHTAGEFADFVVRFSRFSARVPPSTGSPEELQLFRDLTHERLSPPAGELDVVGAARYVLNGRKVDALHAIGKALRPGLLGLFYLAQGIALLRIGWAAWRRQWTYPLTLATAAWGGCAASVLVHAMIEATSFPVLTVSSFAPIYPLVLVFISAVLWDAVTAWRTRSNPSAPIAAAPPSAAVPPPTPGTPLHRALPWLAGLAALVPFLAWQREFRELFWFGDDFFLLDQLAERGLSGWATLVSPDNFVPLFKVLWGGAARVFAGSYPAMLWLLWLTHALNTAALVRLLQRAGFPRFAVLATALLFALPVANLETLGWSVQWSAVLATGFLLLGLEWLERCRDEARLLSWRLHLPLFLFATASACSFSRGVLTGPVLGLGLLLPALAGRDWPAARRRLPGALICALPALVVAGVILRYAHDNPPQLDGALGGVLSFGASYFLLNPAHVLFGTTLHPAPLFGLAVTKLAVLAGALALARGRVLQLLLLLLAYDLGNAWLIGLGRYHGYLASLGSRYQYSSLLATLPFVAVLLTAALERLPEIRHRTRVAALALALVAGWCLWGWPAELKGFTGRRGTELRALVAAPATNDPAVRVPALEFMHIERAKALQRAYHLH